MRITANDIQTRAALTRLLMKIDQDPEYSRQIGVENTSRFRSEATHEEKEVEENAEPVTGYSVCSHTF